MKTPTPTPKTDALVSDKETFCFDATDLEPAMKLAEWARELERGLNVIASMSGLTDAEIDQPRPLTSFLGEIEVKIAELQERAAALHNH